MFYHMGELRGQQQHQGGLAFMFKKYVTRIGFPNANPDGVLVWEQFLGQLSHIIYIF